ASMVREARQAEMKEVHKHNVYTKCFEMKAAEMKTEEQTSKALAYRLKQHLKNAKSHEMDSAAAQQLADAQPIVYCSEDKKPWRRVKEPWVKLPSPPPPPAAAATDRKKQDESSESDRSRSPKRAEPAPPVTEEQRVEDALIDIERMNKMSSLAQILTGVSNRMRDLTKDDNE
ncbi:unnamed protein product, partial [Prorocentrum cordatum]